MPELSPEMRKQQAINEGVADIQRYATEKSAVVEEVTSEFAKEAQEQLMTDLNANYKEAVEEVMIQSGLKLDEEPGTSFYQAAMKEQEGYVRAAFNKIMLEKLPLDQGPKILEALLMPEKLN